MRRLNSVLARILVGMRADRGSASLEFLGVGMLLLLPIVYGTLTLTQVEQALLGTELAARNAARVLTARGAEATELVEHHIALALDNHGLTPAEAKVEIRCAPNPDCQVAGESLSVYIRYELPLPLLAGMSELVSIPVTATSTFPQLRYGAAE